MRRDIREGVKKYMIDGIKPNYAALAKQYGCDYRTVKSAYHEALKGNSPKAKRKTSPLIANLFTTDKRMYNQTVYWRNRKMNG